jgi:pimeloyl-ACP methyl ester carboxylesterase
LSASTSVESRALHVGIWSKGAGSPLLYLHGFEGHPGYAPFLTKLAETRRVIAPVHLGYGTSTPIDHVDDVLDVVFTYRALLEEEDVGPVDVIGHSLGGMFAAELAAFCPHLVKRLVLADSYGLWLDESPIPDPFVLSEEEQIKLLYAHPESAITQGFRRQLWAGLEGDDLAIMKTRHQAAAAKFLWPIPDRGLDRRLRFIKAPVLLVWGQNDALVPVDYAEAFAGHLPGSRIEIVAGAGHSPMIEQPEAFLRVVDAFLA